MKQPRYRIAKLAILLFALGVFSACSKDIVATGNTPPKTSPPAQGPTSTPKKENVPVNGKMLDAKMSDSEILEIFGVDIAKAKKTYSPGPDGSTSTYIAGEQMVSITNSVVTGVAIFASGPIKGNWALGKP